MRNILVSLLEEKSYRLIESEKLDVYSNDLQTEYYIIKEYTLLELANFFESEITKYVIDEFSKLSIKYRNMKKNTSLLILVKVDNIEKIYNDYKKKTLLIEEDIYYFRKFILFYSKDMGKEYFSEYKFKTDLNLSIYNYLDSKIEDFEKNMFFDEIYFMAMQVAIKLPSFTIPDLKNDYQSIEEKYSSNRDLFDNKLIELFEVDENDKIIEDYQNNSELIINISKLLSKEN